jgi:hypothetical protein
VANVALAQNVQNVVNAVLVQRTTNALQNNL